MKEFDEAQAFNKIKLTKKIDHSIFEVNQTLSPVTEQSGTKSNFLIPNLDGKYVNILIQCESSQGDFNSRFFYHFHIWSQF